MRTRTPEAHSKHKSEDEHAIGFDDHDSRDSSMPSSQPGMWVRRSFHSLRANVQIYRESQISSEKSNFGLYHPNNTLVWLFQKMILKNPQALCIWIILEKFENFENFENSQKNTIFILEISQNFERFQRNSSPVDFIFLTYLEDFQSHNTV